MSTTELSKLNTRAPLDRSPKKNWVENAGGLPMYIRRIANHLHAKKGMTISRAIAVAVNAVKRMCSTGDLNWKGRQNVNAASRAEACAAVADWERKKAGARVSKGILGRKLSDAEFIDILVNEQKIHKGCNCSRKRRKKKMQRGYIEKRNFSSQKRRKLASEGKALPDGSFPIENKEDVKNAERLLGHAKNKKKAAKHIAARKKELGISKSEFEELESEINAEIDTDAITFEAVSKIDDVDDEKQIVFGWCSIAKHKDGTVEVDKQGDVLEDIDAMENVAYDFVLNSRDGGEMHVRKGVSTLVESFVSTPEKWEAMEIPEGVLPVGWWVGFKVHDDEVWKGVKSGKYRMFSVHGSGTRKALD